MARRKEPRIPDAILDQLLAGADAKTAFDQGGLLDELKKALAERALNAEMDHHLAGGGGENNSRNGHGRKSVVTDSGRIALEVPRDRRASFDPQLIAKYRCALGPTPWGDPLRASVPVGGTVRGPRALNPPGPGCSAPGRTPCSARRRGRGAAARIAGRGGAPCRRGGTRPSRGGRTA